MSVAVRALKSELKSARHKESGAKQRVQAYAEQLADAQKDYNEALSELQVAASEVRGLTEAIELIEGAQS